MKAWVLERWGAPRQAIHLSTTFPAPTAASLTGSNILVKVSHAAINPVDVHVMQILPSWAPMLPFRPHPIPAMDFAGHIVALGPALLSSSKNKDNLQVGTAVCGCISTPMVVRGHGTLAEYIVVPASLVAVKPPSVTLAQAAGLAGVAGQTAVLVEAETGGIKPGHRVLINGVSGGVGSILLQACKGKGAIVHGICSGANAELARRLGADEVIDYQKSGPVEQFLAGRFRGEGVEEEQYDFVLDTVGGQGLYEKSPVYMKPNGRFVTIDGGPSQGVLPYIMNKLRPVWLGGTPRAYSILLLSPAQRTVQELARWVNDGLVREAVVDSEFAMEEAVEAYEKLQTKRAKGKIIVRVAA
ncbi:hypothetical protein B0T17DRAFT_490895 [Bombardia bombarda]|uniref:Enoyl reductase (ER) domain-containing protein n=1 Tax=Bombardia bombarda TaxID=252184 RepID=A0AA40CB52_9PEZI|nr:hypothetical protein B0T17DRAFT_490895 [Bombardia bombarda]